MPRKKKRTQEGSCVYEVKCKICNSSFKNIIEDLHDQNLNPRQIMDYLKSLSDPEDQVRVIKEGISESSIRRHIDRHYNVKAGTSIKIAETKARLKISREKFKQGVAKKVDSIATLSHMIDVALINIEDLDSIPDNRQKHQLTINYMSTIKGLIDEFSKLTGELKQEGTIDINFFSNQIAEFANVVLATIKKMDEKFRLNSQLEYAFGEEFMQQWKLYKETQNKMISGELPLNYGEAERGQNTFNDISVESTIKQDKDGNLSYANVSNKEANNSVEDMENDMDLDDAGFTNNNHDHEHTLNTSGKDLLNDGFVDLLEEDN